MRINQKLWWRNLCLLSNTEETKQELNSIKEEIDSIRSNWSSIKESSSHSSSEKSSSSFDEGEDQLTTEERSKVYIQNLICSWIYAPTQENLNQENDNIPKSNDSSIEIQTSPNDIILSDSDQIKQSEVKTDEISEVSIKPLIISRETEEIIYYIFGIIASNFNLTVFGEESDEEEEEESEDEIEDDEMMIKVNTVQKVNAPKKSHHNLFLQLRKEQIDPITMMKNFEKTDDDNIRALKFDILLQSENLLNKLAERRKKQDLKNEGKRQSIFTPGIILFYKN